VAARPRGRPTAPVGTREGAFVPAESSLQRDTERSGGGRGRPSRPGARFGTSKRGEFRRSWQRSGARPRQASGRAGSPGLIQRVVAPVRSRGRVRVLVSQTTLQDQIGTVLPGEGREPPWSIPKWYLNALRGSRWNASSPAPPPLGPDRSILILEQRLGNLCCGVRPSPVDHGSAWPSGAWGVAQAGRTWRGRTTPGRPASPREPTALTHSSPRNSRSRASPPRKRPAAGSGLQSRPSGTPPKPRGSAIRRLRLQATAPWAWRSTRLYR
jgi:hypothetical protein